MQNDVWMVVGRLMLSDSLDGYSLCIGQDDPHGIIHFNKSNMGR
jgi:hypothetical protein